MIKMTEYEQKLVEEAQETLDDIAHHVKLSAVFLMVIVIEIGLFWAREVLVSLGLG